MEAASIAHDDHHHGPPEANRSSRVDPQVLGMLLFIISEVMVFGAFFTAYFFIRVVQGDEWFPVDGKERSGWLRADLVERVKRAVKCPVEHVTVEPSSTGAEVPS